MCGSNPYFMVFVKTLGNPDVERTSRSAVKVVLVPVTLPSAMVMASSALSVTLTLY